MSHWSHNICWSCWCERNTDEQGTKRPVRVGTGSERVPEEQLEDTCCFCGRLNIEGIYARSDPVETPCGGTTERHRREDAEDAAQAAGV